MSVERKLEIHNIKYIICYVRQDGRYSTGQKRIRREFYFKKQVIKHLRYAYEHNRVNGEVDIYKLKYTIPSVEENNMDKLHPLR